MGIKVLATDLLAHEQPPRRGENSPRFGRGRRRWRSSWRSKAAEHGANWLHELMNISVVILAAGLGTRMRSKRAKVLHRAGGLALVEHVVGRPARWPRRSASWP